jgi:WS/DGAT/MGAT family acyltransferase
VVVGRGLAGGAGHGWPKDTRTVRQEVREEREVPDRLSSLDVSFLYLEDAATAMHTGSVMVFETPGGGLDHAALVDHIEACVALAPRYRQRVRGVPGHLANPVWVDDEQFDISYHVRFSALPRPGTAEQRQGLVARVQAQRLDRSRPLWEVVVVEGLEGDRFALVTKVHQAMVDGVATVDLGQIILDASPAAPELPLDGWSPRHEPNGAALLGEALTELVRRPGQVLDTVRSGLNDVRSVAAQVAGAVPGLVSTARNATRSAPRSPLNRAVSEHRRFVMLETDLDHYRAVRAGAPGASVNDVVLATLSGALRAWLLTRAEPVRSTTSVRTLVPVSVRVEDPAEAPALGSRVASLLVDLPIGEPSPLVRLHQIAYQTKAHRDTGQAVAAPTLAGIAGFAPPTLHALGARVASGISTRMFSLVVTNVPGPQQRLYLAGAPMLATYPVVPLFQGQALSVGVTS